MGLKICVGIDNVSYNKKPEKYEIARARKRAVTNYGEYDLKDIADHVGNYGHAMVPSILVGGIKQENFKSIQLFMLDFDGCKDGKGVNISYDEVKEKANRYGLKIAFAYRTLSCPDTIPFFKFRIAFVHNIPLPDKNLAKLVYRLLLKIFPEADTACQNLDRVFLGGKELIDYDGDARIDIVSLLHGVIPLLDVNNHYKENIRSIIKGTDIAILNNQIAIEKIENLSLFCETMDSANICILGESTNSQIFYVKKSSMKPEILHQKHTCMNAKYKINLDLNKGICKLLDDFLDGIELSHMERFLLVTSLSHICGGFKLFMERLYTDYGEEVYYKWHSEKKRLTDYNPKSCCEDCRYYDECVSNKGKAQSPLLKIYHDRSIFCKNSTVYRDTDESYSFMRDNLEKAMRSQIDGIHLIYGQTGIGKTRAIIELIKDYPIKKILIAEPTCIMKKEIYDKLIYQVGKESVKMIRSVRDPDAEGFVSKEIQDEFFAYHESGRHVQAKKILKDLLDKVNEETPEATTKIELIEDIIKGVKTVQDERVVITTHASLLTMTEEDLNRYDMVIIDEDIIYTQILGAIKRIDYNTLVQVLKTGIPGYSQIASELLKAKEGYYSLSHKYSMLPEWDSVYRSKIDEEEDDEIIIGQDENNNISDLAKAGSYTLKDGVFEYFSVSKLPRHKYTVLSATINEEIYSQYFGEDLPIVTYEQSEAKYMGTIDQFTHYSLGRSDLNKNNKKEACIQFVKDKLNDTKLPIISFKSMGKLNDYNLHFGNAIGVNDLKGKDIAVVGTPFKNPLAYYLPYCYIYGETSVKYEDMKKRRVEYNGYSFVIMTYADPKLQNLMLYMIESDLEQAIGRARLLRTDAHVVVLSGFPCKQAIIHTEDYLEGYITEEGGSAVVTDPWR